MSGHGLCRLPRRVLRPPIPDAPLPERDRKVTEMMRDARIDAMRRLEVALLEQDRLGEQYRAAVGTSSEFGAYVRLRGASDEVAARDAWLASLDDEPTGRAWVNGREVGGTDSVFVGLEEAHD